METIYIKRKNAPIIFTLVLGLLLAAGMAWLIVGKYQEDEGHTIVTNMYIFLGVLGLFMTWYSLRRLMGTSIGLVISEEGIVDNLGPFPGHLIRWQDIMRLELKKRMNQDCLAIHFNGSDALLLRLPRTKRNVADRNIRTLGAPEVVVFSMYETSGVATYNLIEQKCKEKNPPRSSAMNPMP